MPQIFNPSHIMMSDSLLGEVQGIDMPREPRNVVVTINVTLFDGNVDIIGTALTFMFDDEGGVEIELRSLFDDVFDLMMKYLSKSIACVNGIKFKVLDQEHNFDRQFELSIVRIQDIDEQNQMATLAMKLKESCAEVEGVI